LKNLADAVALRNKILTAFEMAEAEENPARHKDLLTFVLVGAGPTGVELASAIAILVRSTLKRNFRRIDPGSARIVLIDMADRPLGTFAPELSEAALRRLTTLGVEVRLGKGVDSIDGAGVTVGDERIASKTVIWTAGVAPSPAGKWLKAETDRAGRVKIQSDLSVQDHPEVFVVGDTASLEQDGKAGHAIIFDSALRSPNRQAAGQKADRPENRDFQYFRWLWSCRALPEIEDVGDDEDGEQRTLANDQG
jgi:NADH dehydrogenase FAD-containing subunit